MPLTPRENLSALVAGESPEWIPFSLDVGAAAGFSPPLARRLQAETGQTDWAEYFNTDTRRCSVRAVFGGRDPRALHGKLSGDVTFDEWGIGHTASSVEGTLDRMHPPLASVHSPDEVESHPEPRIETEGVAAEIARHHAAGLPVLGYAGSIYEWSWWLRGMEAFLVDLKSEPEMAEAIVRKVEAHTTRLALSSASCGVDVLCFYDDVGMQRGMQIHPDLWRRFIKPAWRRVLQAVAGAYPEACFFLHSCGKIDAIVPDIVELGFHALHPLQPECMDFAAAYRQYGEQIALCGTLSSQRTLPFGTADDVRAAVARIAQIAGPRRRTWVMPSNVLQPETPWANIVALAEAAHAARRLP